MRLKIKNFTDMPSIAEGRSLIYVMREKKAPDKSLITIELTPKTHKIRQKLLAYN